MLNQCIRSLSDGLEGTGAEPEGVCMRDEKEGWHLGTWKQGGALVAAPWQVLRWARVRSRAWGASQSEQGCMNRKKPRD